MNLKPLVTFWKEVGARAGRVGRAGTEIGWGGRLACIAVLLFYLAIAALLGFATLLSQAAAPVPSPTQLAILAFAAADVAAIGLVAFSRRLPLFAQAMLLGPALGIAGCSAIFG